MSSATSLWAVLGVPLVWGGEVASSTSSSTMVDHAMARKETSPLYQDCKVSTVTDEDITAYHVAGWLSRALVCTPTILNFPTIN
jgi:hypothetical protein